MCVCVIKRLNVCEEACLTLFVSCHHLPDASRDPSAIMLALPIQIFYKVCMVQTSSTVWKEI